MLRLLAQSGAAQITVIDDDRVDESNPLGRVLAVFDKNRAADSETLELKLDEVVLRESSQIQRLMWIVKTVSVVAPLLGLLGTVTGMIQTFQAITLYGGCRLFVPKVYLIHIIYEYNQTYGKHMYYQE